MGISDILHDNIRKLIDDFKNYDYYDNYEKIKQELIQVLIPLEILRIKYDFPEILPEEDMKRMALFSIMNAFNEN